MRYLFKTDTTMKEYNCNNYWIDRDYIKELVIEAKDVNEALMKYVESVEKNNYINISKNAIRNKRFMYRDNPTTKQVGFVLTGETEIDYKKQFVDLWIEIFILSRPSFKEVKVYE